MIKRWLTRFKVWFLADIWAQVCVVKAQNDQLKESLGDLEGRVNHLDEELSDEYLGHLDLSERIGRLERTRPVPIPQAVYEYVPTAKVLVDEQETLSRGTSGEYKRHRVYAKLIDLYPKANRRDLGLAIELALCSG